MDMKQCFCIICSNIPDIDKPKLTSNASLLLIEVIYMNKTVVFRFHLAGGSQKISFDV